jgi:26S proteasome regulatory subunit N8
MGYSSINEVQADGTQATRFMHIPSSVEAFEPEEVGVEHLLREIKDVTTGELSTQVLQKISSLKGLISKMNMIKKYLMNVTEKKVPKNN